jgi:transposase-like protein
LSIFLANDCANQKKDPIALILYALYLYFSSLSVRRASHILEPIIKRSHVAIWKWIQKHSFVFDSFDVDKHDVNSIFIDETEINVKTKLGYG